MFTIRIEITYVSPSEVCRKLHLLRFDHDWTHAFLALKNRYNNKIKTEGLKIIHALSVVLSRDETE